jgi:hypothetical protein
MIQGGCPEGSGRGGPGYEIDAEFNDTPHELGVLSMARTSDPNSAGSFRTNIHPFRPPCTAHHRRPLLTALPDQPQTDEYQRQPTGCGEQRLAIRKHIEVSQHLRRNG